MNMVRIIHFDCDNPYWCMSPKARGLFVDTQIDYVFSKLKAKEHLYLSEIYEVFGGRFDPKEPNDLITLTSGLRFSCQVMDDYEILIRVYYQT